jgi:hypothetical protein
MVSIEWLQAVGTVLISFLSAYGASLLAYGKFKRERNWDERTKAYSTVLDAIEEMLFWCEQARAEHCCEPFNGTATDFEANHRTLIRATAFGEVLFSTEFLSGVKKADLALAQAIYDANEESRELCSPREIATAHYHRAIAIREALTPHFVELSKIAKAEKNRMLLVGEWPKWLKRSKRVLPNVGS